MSSLILTKLKDLLIFIWFFNNIFLIIIILISNPKANALGLGSTMSTQRTLDKLTWNLIAIFFILTALISYIINNLY